MTKYKLGICELFNPEFHGFDNDSDPEVLYHYLIIDMFDFDDCDDFEDYDEHQQYEREGSRSGSILKLFRLSNSIINLHKKKYKRYIKNKENTPHPIIKNYNNIISKKDYIKLDIIEKKELNGEEHVAIIKTFWLKLVQRKWKKIFNERKIKINLRKNINNLNFRHINGFWPQSCNILPEYRGMLSNI